MDPELYKKILAAAAKSTGSANPSEPTTSQGAGNDSGAANQPSLHNTGTASDQNRSFPGQQTSNPANPVQELRRAVKYYPPEVTKQFKLELLQTNPLMKKLEAFKANYYIPKHQGGSSAALKSPHEGSGPQKSSRGQSDEAMDQLVNASVSGASSMNRPSSNEGTSPSSMSKSSVDEFGTSEFAINCLLNMGHIDQAVAMMVKSAQTPPPDQGAPNGTANTMPTMNQPLPYPGMPTMNWPHQSLGMSAMSPSLPYPGPGMGTMNLPPQYPGPGMATMNQPPPYPGMATMNQPPPGPGIANQTLTLQQPSASQLWRTRRSKPDQPNAKKQKTHQYEQPDLPPTPDPPIIYFALRNICKEDYSGYILQPILYTPSTQTLDIMPSNVQPKHSFNRLLAIKIKVRGNSSCYLLQQKLDPNHSRACVFFTLEKFGSAGYALRLDANNRNGFH